MLCLLVALGTCLSVPGANVTVWGDGSYGQWGVPANLTNAVAIACGADHILALRTDGTVSAWGRNDRGQASVPPGLDRVVAVAAGDSHSFALRVDGTVVAWGRNNEGQTTLPADLGTVAAIASGKHHGLALRSDGTVVGWGLNDDGQTDIPPELGSVRTIAGGRFCSFAITAQGQLVGWGSNTDGQTDIPPDLGTPQQFSASYHNLALLNGTVRAWERNEEGQCNVPADLGSVQVVSAGALFSLALRANGTIAAWGSGAGDPAFLAGLSNVVAISASWTHNLALHTDGTVTSWGLPGVVPPITLPRVRGVAAGCEHGLAWLDDTDGQPLVLPLPRELSVLVNEPFYLRGTAVGLGRLDYRWEADTSGHAGSAQAVLQDTIALPGTVTYRCIVSNALGVATGNAVRVTAKVPPARLRVTDSVPPESDRLLPFGPIRVGAGQTERITLANVGATDPLTVTNIALAVVGDAPFTLANLPPLPFLLPPGASVVFDVRYAPLQAGAAIGTVIVASDDAFEPRVEVEVRGSAIDACLSVAPVTPWLAIGHPGGPFVPGEQVYTLISTGGLDLAWSVCQAPAWLAASPASGTLAAGATVAVHATPTAAAGLLQPGVHTSEIVFSNLTSGAAYCRAVTLEVISGPQIEISPTSLSVTSRAGRVANRIVRIANHVDADAALDVRLGVCVSGLAPVATATAPSAADANGPPAGPEAVREAVREVLRESWPDAASQVHGRDYAERELLVRFHSGIDGPRRLQLLAAAGGGAVLRTFGLVSGLVLVRIPANTDLAPLAARYGALPGIRYAIPNYRRRPCIEPDDPHFEELWGLHNTGQSGGTPDADVDAPDAWEASRDATSVIVAVIDTGVDYLHEDLAPNMWTNPGEIPGNGIDDDGNGYVDDVHGYDFANFDAAPMDDHGHGTHCAGTIAAAGNNGVGVVGVCWRGRIMALKFFDAAGVGYDSGAIACIEYAVRMGARVLSNSWGGGGASAALEDAIAAAGAAGVVFVSAAGNYGENTDVYPHYPSSLTAPNVVAVMATTRTDARASFSNYGLQSVDLGAPGSEILSCLRNGGYTTMSGTSMATPHVAGACALVLDANPSLTVAAVKRVLMDSVDPTLPGLCASGGRLNLARTLTAARHWLAVSPTVITGLAPGQAADVTVTLDATDLTPGTYPDQIEIQSNDRVLPLVFVPVEFVVLAPEPPADWLARYGLPTDGSADHRDDDLDGADNWSEWIADTDPTNVNSVLRVEAIVPMADGLRVRWQSVVTRTYWLERATRLSPPDFLRLEPPIPGVAGSTAHTDPAPGGGPRYYRVGVVPPE